MYVTWDMGIHLIRPGVYIYLELHRVIGTCMNDIDLGYPSEKIHVEMPMRVELPSGMFGECSLA